MTDVFFSYSSKDRERVRPIRDALVAEGFDVFWDQEVPAGRNWDEWIRQHLSAARCAIVFWSATSVASDNVIHEATIAKNAGKLIPVLLDPVATDQFPMGHYTTQGLFWPAEGPTQATLQRLMEEVEQKAMRRWMRRKIAELEGQAISLKAKSEQLEDREAVLVRRIAELERQLVDGRREKAPPREAVSAVDKPTTGIDSKSYRVESKRSTKNATILPAAWIFFLWLSLPLSGLYYWQFDSAPNTVRTSCIIGIVGFVISLIKGIINKNKTVLIFSIAFPILCFLCAFLLGVPFEYLSTSQKTSTWAIVSIIAAYVISFKSRALNASYDRWS